MCRKYVGVCTWHPGTIPSHGTVTHLLITYLPLLSSVTPITFLNPLTFIFLPVTSLPSLSLPSLNPVTSLPCPFLLLTLSLSFPVPPFPQPSLIYLFSLSLPPCHPSSGLPPLTLGGLNVFRYSPSHCWIAVQNGCKSCCGSHPWPAG